MCVYMWLRAGLEDHATFPSDLCKACCLFLSLGKGDPHPLPAQILPQVSPRWLILHFTHLY